MTASFYSYRQRFTVAFEFPVVFTRDLFDPANLAFVDAATRLKESRIHRAVVFIDSCVARHHPALAGRIEQYFSVHAKQIEMAAPPQIVPGGEIIKNDLKRFEEIVRRFLDVRLCRHSLAVAIGGGAVLDAIGLASALFHRGLRLIRVPTTVLAQNDVGVGVKNAMNFGGGKNLIGTFSPPFAVLNDFDFLHTLSDRHWIGGIAEAFKVAIIRDGEFFKWLCKHARKLRGRDGEKMEHLIRRCAELHLDHIRTNGDPFEFGRARPLDFGHWSAHKIESMSGYRIGHGEAVATGIALDSCYAARKGWITEKECRAIRRGLVASGFSLWRPLLERKMADGRPEILKGLKDFQEHLGGELLITFPKGIGRKFEMQEMDTALVQTCIEDLKKTG